MLTERTIFFSSNPRSLLFNFSYSDLEKYFGPSYRSHNLSLYIDQLIEHINIKYRKIDLITWDGDIKNTFYDYSSNRIISLYELEKNIDKYSTMALQNLKQQLIISINHFNNTFDDFDILLVKIDKIINNILNIKAIIED